MIIFDDVKTTRLHEKNNNNVILSILHIMQNVPVMQASERVTSVLNNTVTLSEVV